MILNHLEIIFLLLKKSEVWAFFWLKSGILRLVYFSNPVTILLQLFCIREDMRRAGLQKSPIDRFELVGIVPGLPVTHLIVVGCGYVQDLRADGL